MDISIEKQEDGKRLVIFTHNGVTDTRSIDPVLTEEKEIDEDLTNARIAEIANAIEVKIDMGIITNNSIYMNSSEALSESFTHHFAVSPTGKVKPA